MPNPTPTPAPALGALEAIVEHYTRQVDLLEGSGSVRDVSEHRARIADARAALPAITAALSQGAADAAPEGLEPIAYLAADSAKDLNEVRIERRIQRDGRVLWVVIEQFGDVLNHSGEWEYEPMPSSRDDDFLARTRYESVAAAATAFKASTTLSPTRAGEVSHG